MKGKAMKCTKGKNKCAVIDNYNLFRRENNTSYWKGLLAKTVERKGETFALKVFSLSLIHNTYIIIIMIVLSTNNNYSCY